jgi:hypothetical protein
VSARLIIMGRNGSLPRDAAQALGGCIAPRFPATHINILTGKADQRGRT